MTKKLTISIAFLVLLMSVLPNVALAQKKERTRLKANYEKLDNNDKQISIELISGKGKNMSGVFDADIHLTIMDGEDELDLTQLVTDEEGMASLVIEAGYTLPKDSAGYSQINVSYNGNDSLRASSNEVVFRDLNLSISFDEIDSIRTVNVFAYLLDSLGGKIPVEEVEMKIGVQRLHSVLYLEEVETDDDGIAGFEFPSDIPGDDTGNVIIRALVFENDDYGTINVSGEIQWGTIVDYNNTMNGRSLFGNEAPLWMIIGVFVVLFAAWYHFILAIWKVVQIKKFAPKEG